MVFFGKEKKKQPQKNQEELMWLEICDQVTASSFSFSFCAANRKIRKQTKQHKAANRSPPVVFESALKCLPFLSESARSPRR
jgi:hypothetical protein